MAQSAQSGISVQPSLQRIPSAEQQQHKPKLFSTFVCDLSDFVKKIGEYFRTKNHITFRNRGHISSVGANKV